MLLTLAWRNLWRNKRRTLITAASVFFAVILSTLMQSMQRGTYAVMIRNVVQYYTGYIQIQHSRYQQEPVPDNSLEDNDALQKTLINTDGITAIVPRIENFALVSVADFTKGALIVGTDPAGENKLTGLGLKVTEGKYFDVDSGQVLVAEGLAKGLRCRTGDSLIILGQGYMASSSNGIYRIGGIIKFGNPELNNRMVYMPVKTAQQLFSLSGRYTSVALGVKDPSQTQSIADGIAGKLHNTEIAVRTWWQLLPELKESIDADKVAGGIMLGVLYLIISFGIFGTVLMMLAERRHEFGVMVAIGTKRIKLALMVFLEILNITLIGSVAGMVAAIPVIYYFHVNPIPLQGRMAESSINMGFEPILQTSLNPVIFINNGVAVFLLAMIVSVYPVYKLLKFNTIQALKS